jgi:hypothetical protein
MFINDTSLVNKSTKLYDVYQRYVFGKQIDKFLKWLSTIHLITEIKNYVWAARESSYEVMKKRMEFDEKRF